MFIKTDLNDTVRHVGLESRMVQAADEKVSVDSKEKVCSRRFILGVILAKKRIR